MDPNTFREGDPDPEDPATYWRRRVFALGGVLAAVALLAWACSGSGGDDDKQKVAQQSARPSSSPMATVTVTVSPTPSASASSGTPSPSGSASPSTSDSASPSETPSPTKLGPGDPCDPSDVVVTAHLGDETYHAGHRPTFSYTLVNTGQRTCTYDVGPDGLELRITSGSDRIWSSGDCAKGAADSKRLKRGVPYTRTVTWNRTRSNPDCDHTDKKARPGTYVVKLRGDDVKTRSHVFYLR